MYTIYHIFYYIMASTIISNPPNPQATGSFCSYDARGKYGSVNRPLAGYVNFCPGKIYTDEARFGYMLDTAIHEMMHSLAFTSRLYSLFIDPETNTPLGEDRVWSKEGGVPVMMTPAV